MEIKKIQILLLLIYFWVARNTILVRRRDTGDFAAVDAMALLQIATVLLLFALFYIAYKKLTVKTLHDIYRKPARWFFLLYLLGLISAFWSPLFGYSAYKAFECLVLFFSVFIYLNSKRNFLDTEIIFLRFIVTLLLFNFFGQIKMYGFSISLETLHTNSYSLIAVILFLYSFGELMSKSKKTIHRKKMLKKYARIGFVFIILGTSAASNISTALGFLLLAIFTNRSDLKIIGLAVLMVSSPFIFMMGDISTIQEILLPGKSAEGIASMTGRMGLWDEYFLRIYERPFLGWGFAVIARISEHATTNTHNSILSILTGMGGIGCLIFVIFVIRSTISIFSSRKKKHVGSIGSGVAIIASLANAMSVAIIGEGVSPATLSFVALIAFYHLTVNNNQMNRNFQRM